MKVRYAYARKVARLVLKRAGITKPPVPVEEFARRKGAIVRYVPFEERNVSGLLYCGADGRRIIGVNSIHAPTRQRFTIAHELGHLYLHDMVDVHVDESFRVAFREQLSEEGTDPQEIEANQFAAELLMPADFLKRDARQWAVDMDMDMDEVLQKLARRYRVSTLAMSIRLGSQAVLR